MNILSFVTISVIANSRKEAPLPAIVLVGLRLDHSKLMAHANSDNTAWFSSWLEPVLALCPLVRIEPSPNKLVERLVASPSICTLPYMVQCACCYCRLPSGDVDVQIPDASVDIPTADISSPSVDISGDASLPEVSGGLGIDAG